MKRMSLILLTSFSCFATVERIALEQAMFIRLKQFHNDTGRREKSPIPTVDKIKQAKRVLIAKMHSYGGDSYFRFETNDDVSAFHQAVRRGGAGMYVSWYYLDKDPAK